MSTLPRITRLGVAFRLSIAFLLVAIFAVAACLIQVRPGTTVIITRLGDPVAVLHEPGPALRWPRPIERAVVIPTPLRTTASGQIRTIMGDGISLVFEAYALWRVDSSQVVTWLRATRNDPDQAAMLLRTIMASALQTASGKYRLDQIVNLDPKAIHIDTLSQDVLTEVRRQLGDRYGISIEYLGFQRVFLPEGIVTSTIATMAEERKIIAERRLAEGRTEAAAITAQANQESRTLLANAREEAATILAQATTEANRVYALAHDADPKLYRFLREMATLEKALGERTTLVLSASAPPLRSLVEGVDSLLPVVTDDHAP